MVTTTPTAKSSKPAKKPLKKKAGGRPSRYKVEYAERAEQFCMLGATDAELGTFFGVDERTINRWKEAHKEFCQSLKAGKERADATVAAKLFHRATGYEHPEVHVSNYRGAITLTPLIKHYAPDTTAAIFWLKNRRPDLWRDRVELAGDPSSPLLVQLVRYGDDPTPQ